MAKCYCNDTSTNSFHFFPENLTKKHNEPNFNVVLLGLDSVSRAHAQRKLPKTYDFFRRKGIILENYHVVGKNTQPNMIPLLTGNSMKDFPDLFTSGNSDSRMFADQVPNIFKAYENFTTSFYEDMPKFNIFNFVANGFLKPPSDVYSRIFNLHAEKLAHGYCYGSKTKFKTMLDWYVTKLIADAKSPVFSLMFSAEFSHADPNTVSYTDDLILETLQNLPSNTIFSLFSDHGFRVGSIYEDTIQGKLEHMLPLNAWYFPESFQLEKKKLYNNFIRNKNEFITPYDIYKSLRTLAGKSDNVGLGNNLFEDKYPKKGCKESNIPASLCACHDWKPLFSNIRLTKEMASIFGKTNNQYKREKLMKRMDSLGQKCAEGVNRRMEDKNAFDDCIRWKFNEAEMAIYAESEYETFVRLSVNLSPISAGAKYDCTVKVVDDTIELVEVIRTSKYGKQSSCLGPSLIGPLREYCCCKNFSSCKHIL